MNELSYIGVSMKTVVHGSIHLVIDHDEDA